MMVVGQFSSVTDLTSFAYVRTFDSLEQREEQYRTFYESEDWLGWMIDVAIGKEESFEVFLGGSEPLTIPVTDVPSGVHAARFTLASSKGVIASVCADTLTVTQDDGATVTYAVNPHVRLFFTPVGRGLTPAKPIALSDLAEGDRVLVLGAETEDGPQARQIVRRPNVD